MHYADMTIEAFDVPPEPGADSARDYFKVRVLSSPAGEQSIVDAQLCSYDRKQLQDQINLIANQSLDLPGLIAFGRDLAACLLPPATAPGAIGVRELYDQALMQPGQDGGLRLRLRLSPALARIPWEYIYIDQAGGGDGMDGFLALNPRVPIVRHESLPLEVRKVQPPPETMLSVVAALALADDLPELDLKQEQAEIDRIFSTKGVKHRFLEQSTIEDILENAADAHIFHFAGHGSFTTKQTQPRAFTGIGALALAGTQRVDAEQLGLNLRGNHLRLAVLGACESGKRGGANVINPWGAIAPMLIKVGIPAVVANQFKVLDECAIAFSKAFYQALFGGLSIERAVIAGRLAAYNAKKDGRDWGVQVLYMRAGDGELFAGVSDPIARKQARAAAEQIIEQHIAIQGDNNIVNATTVQGDEVRGNKFIVQGNMVMSGDEPELRPTPPLVPRHYVAREPIEEELRKALLMEDDSVPLVVLYGSEGVGKGTLATYVVDRLYQEGRFAGGVLWGDCAARTPVELLRDFLGALGRKWYDASAQREISPALLWTTLDQRQEESGEPNTRTLVVVDNVRDLNQIKQIMPGTRTRSRLLALCDTTRVDGAGLGMSGSFLIEPFEPEQSIQLFQKILGESKRALGQDIVKKYRETLIEIGEIFNHMPPLVATAAQNLAESNMNPQAYLRQLKQHEGQHDAMGEALLQAQDLVIHDLTPLQADLFALTSVFGEGDWSAAMLASVALCPVRDVRQALDALVRRNLLSCKAERYRTNTIFRELARRRFEARTAYEREAANHLLARWCLNAAQDLEATIHWQEELSSTNPDGEANEQFYTIFRDRLTPEMPHIRRVLEWATQREAWDILYRFAYLSYMGLVKHPIWDSGNAYIELQMGTIEGLVIGGQSQHRLANVESFVNNDGLLGFANPGGDPVIYPNSELAAAKIKPLLQQTNLGRSEVYFVLTSGQIKEGSIASADLVYGKWSGVSADRLILSDVHMVGARFVACRLVWSVWRSCDASRAVLTGSDLSYAILRQVKLRGADLRDVDFTSAVLDDVDLRDADLRGANLSGVYLKKVNLLGAQLDNVIWAGATEDANEGMILDSDLRDDIRQVIQSQPAPALLTLYGWTPGARDLSDMECPLASFPKADLRATDQLRVHFNQSTLREADFRAARMAEAHIDRTHMRGSDFRAAQLSNAHISGASLQETNFRAARLDNARIERSKLPGADFYAACMEVALIHDTGFADASFCSASLGAALFYRADLRRSNLAHANLTMASLCEVDLSDALNLSEDQLKSTQRLRGSILPNGTRYAGQYGLPGDLDDAKALGIDPNDHPTMAEFFAAAAYPASFLALILEHLVLLHQDKYQERARLIANTGRLLMVLTEQADADPMQLLSYCEELRRNTEMLTAMLPYARELIESVKTSVLDKAVLRLDQQVAQAHGVSRAAKLKIKEALQRIRKEILRGADVNYDRLGAGLDALRRLAPEIHQALLSYLRSPIMGLDGI